MELEENVEQVEKQEPKDDYVEQARSMGWNESYDGPDKLDAKEFVLRKPLYDEMKKLRKKTRELENAVRAQQQMHEVSLQKQKEQLLKQYKAAKIEAMEAGDNAKVVELEDAIEQTKQIEVKAPQQGPNPEFVDWIEKRENSWYSEDEDMRAWADTYGVKLYNEATQRGETNPSLTSIYNAVTRRAREVFPHKFKNSKRDEPAAVDSGSKGSKTEKEEEFEIPKEFNQVFHTLWRAGAWGDIPMKEAKKKYAADLKAMEE